MGIPTTPKLRVELDGVRHALITHLQAHHQEIEAIIEKAIQEIDLEDLIKTQVNMVLPGLLKEAIADAIRHNVNSVITHNYELRDALAGLIVDKMYETLRPPGGTVGS